MVCVGDRRLVFLQMFGVNAPTDAGAIQPTAHHRQIAFVDAEAGLHGGSVQRRQHGARGIAAARQRQQIEKCLHRGVVAMPQTPDVERDDAGGAEYGFDGWGVVRQGRCTTCTSAGFDVRVGIEQTEQRSCSTSFRAWPSGRRGSARSRPGPERGPRWRPAAVPSAAVPSAAVRRSRMSRCAAASRVLASVPDRSLAERRCRFRRPTAPACRAHGPAPSGEQLVAGGEVIVIRGRHRPLAQRSNVGPELTARAQQDKWMSMTLAAARSMSR